MSTAEELAPVPSPEEIAAAVDRGIAAVRERIAELEGDAQDEADAFWADGSERANLVRIAHLSILGHTGGTALRDVPSAAFPPDALVNGAHLTGRYVATVSMELGIHYQNLHGNRDGLGPVFCRFVADRKERQEKLAETPRL